MSLELSDLYPLSKNKNLKGNRRLAREKVMQVLLAFEFCELDIKDIFFHVFFREFNFEEDFDEQFDKLLNPEEIYEIEADTPIVWKEEEILFAKELIGHIQANKDETNQLIEDFAKNWEMERIAPIDKILLEIGVAELMHFPEIPPKVSINEAIDISKKYSTEKSNQFINGILDSVLDKIKAEGKLSKTGRGLKED